MVKKVFALLICFVTALSIASCKSQPEPDSIPNQEQEETVPVPEPDPDPMPWDLYSFNKLTGEFNIDKEFEGIRPVAIMVNNNTHGLPQRGIADCDLLMEIEVEGGITRLMAFFSDYRRITQVGTVRSLRNQFLDIARPYDAMIIHVGSSVYANQALNRYGYKTLDAMGCTIVSQDKSRLEKYASEHTWFTDPELIASAIDARRMRLDDESPDAVFSFVEYGTEAVLDDGIATSAKWAFSDSYDGKTQYDPSTQSYTFWQHGDQRYDELSGDPISYQNVFLLIASRSGFYGNGVPEYNFSAGGKGFYLSRGKYEEFTWTKDSAESRFVFKHIKKFRP